MSEAKTPGQRDLTAFVRFASGGQHIGRSCGIWPKEHKTYITAGGKKVRGIWYCAACIGAGFSQKGRGAK